MSDRPSPARLWALRILRFPSRALTSRMRAKTGETRAGLGEDRMIMRTLIDAMVWSIILLALAWVLAMP